VAAYEMSVSVVTQYLQEQSNPDQANFVFAYTITIKNMDGVSAGDFASLDYYRCKESY
jgi:ApaG protein